MICASLALLQIMFAVHRFAQGATAALSLRVADCRSAAMLIKSALRDNLSLSSGMISILVISRCAAPPYPAAPDFPPKGETTHYDLCVAGAPSNHVRCASLRSGGDSGSAAEGCGLPLCGNAYKVSVTGLTFSVIRQNSHSADWLAALATPYPAVPDFPLCRGQNKTPRDNLLINPPLEMTVLADPLSSFRPQRSGVEKSPPSDGPGSITARELQAQSFIGAVPVCPYTGACPSR